MSHTLRTWRSVLVWRRRSRSAEELCANGVASRLRLVLGAGRSGTTWTARVLGHTSTPTRLVQEPLFHLRPRLNLVAGSDPTAIGVRTHLPPRHRLLTSYRWLASDRTRLDRNGVAQRIERDDPSWQACIVKEVHALLAAEAVVRNLTCPIILVVRDPVMTVDSILRTNGWDSGYLEGEADHLLERAQENQVGDRFEWLRSAMRRLCDSAAARQRTVLRLAFAVASLQLLFARLAAEYEHIQLIRYEDLCEQSSLHFRRLAAHFCLEWDAAAKRYLAQSSGPPQTSSPYETRRVAHQQLLRRPSVLRPDDLTACERLFEQGGWGVSNERRLFKAA